MRRQEQRARTRLGTDIQAKRQYKSSRFSGCHAKIVLSSCVGEGFCMDNEKRFLFTTCQLLTLVCWIQERRAFAYLPVSYVSFVYTTTASRPKCMISVCIHDCIRGKFVHLIPLITNRCSASGMKIVEDQTQPGSRNVLLQQQVGYTGRKVLEL